jgi:hypothetical protein
VRLCRDGRHQENEAERREQWGAKHSISVNPIGRPKNVYRPGLIPQANEGRAEHR